MNWNDYLKASARTDTAPGDGTTHAILGIVTESGELAGALKKNLFYSKPLDDENVREEIGDLMWYIAKLCRNQHLVLENILSENIDKLLTRYPEGFSSERATVRLDKQ